jgi:hypothetical protein
MPYAIQGGHIPLTLQYNHFLRDELGFPGEIKPPSMDLSLPPFKFFF